MARNNTQLQADYDEALEDIARAKSTLEAAYTPEATRSELAERRSAFDTGRLRG
jgi:hypothetical protein